MTVARTVALVALLAAIAGCSASPPPKTPPTPALDSIQDRVELYDPERSAWLHEHCEVIGTTEHSSGWSGWGNYIEVLVVDEEGVTGVELACPEQPPWPRLDRQAKMTDLKDVSSRVGWCRAKEPWKPEPFTVVKPGEGQPVSATAFVAYRERHLSGKTGSMTWSFFHGRQVDSFEPAAKLAKEVPPGTIIPMETGWTWEIQHGSCVDKGHVLRALAPGGVARIENKEGVKEIEVLGVGDEAFLRREIGLDPR